MIIAVILQYIMGYLTNKENIIWIYEIVIKLKIFNTKCFAIAQIYGLSLFGLYAPTTLTHSEDNLDNNSERLKEYYKV